jgi:hypothetical protein
LDILISADYEYSISTQAVTAPARHLMLKLMWKLEVKIPNCIASLGGQSNHLVVTAK